MAKKFDQLFKEFSGLKHEEKKQKVIAMLDYIKDKMNMAQAINTFIQGNPNISDDFLERQYSMIMKIALESSEEKMTSEAQQRLEKIASLQKANSEKDHQDQAEAENMLNTLS